jgi:hypothetical protein
MIIQPAINVWINAAQEKTDKSPHLNCWPKRSQRKMVEITRW